MTIVGPSGTAADRVPRLVHLIWLGSDVPARLRQLRADVARHDPDVEVRTWTDRDLTWLENRSELRDEPRLSGRANIARYEVLLRHGGIYLDADSRVHQSLADVFTAVDRHGLVVARQSRAVYNPAFIAAMPGHRALALAVEGISAAHRRFAAMTSPARTGPHHFTAALLEHVRAGGSFHELPQHAVFPWGHDEDALPDAATPAAVLMSHGWATTDGRWSGDDLTTAPEVIRVPSRRTRMRRNGGTVRARAAATPSAHRAIARGERIRDRIDLWPATPAADPRVEAASAVLEGWTARLARRDLRGSATFVDLDPASWLPALTAAEALDRPGRTIVVRDGDRPAPPPRWADRSVRCSVHDVVRIGDGSDTIAAIRSLGSPLVARTIDQRRPPIDHTDPAVASDVAGLLADLPRMDVVRARADRLTVATAAVLRDLTRARRIARLLITVDPMATSPGIDAATDLLGALDERGLRVRLAPWIVDGRGRTWREQLRVAARPFLVTVGP